MRGYGQHLFVLLTGLVIALQTGEFAPAAEPEDDELARTSYTETLAKIRTVAKTSDLDRLEEFADQVHARWSRADRDIGQYSHLIHEIVNAFSGAYSDQTRPESARRFAALALADADKLPIEVEVKLVRHFSGEFHPRNLPDKSTWDRRRSQEVKYWFHAYKRLNDSMDPTWDPKVRVVGNVSPDGVRSGGAGMDPEGIEDPMLRAAYRAKIAANSALARQRGGQLAIIKLRTDFVGRFEKNIIAFYSLPPFNDEELVENLDRYMLKIKKPTPAFLRLSSSRRRESRRTRSSQSAFMPVRGLRCRCSCLLG